ncbi:hypothetical protein ACQP3J_33540, partial [Escherichia coli]
GQAPQERYPDHPSLSGDQAKIQDTASTEDNSTKVSLDVKCGVIPRPTISFRRGKVPHVKQQ